MQIIEHAGSLFAAAVVGWNILTFFVYGLDKYKAKTNRWRVPEKTLLFLAALGGSIGALAGMYVFHHKTKKRKFTWGVPLILLVQVAVLFVASGKVWV